MPVWETLLLDAAGTVVSAFTIAAAAWLAHRKGWLGGPLAKLGGWVAAHSGEISADLLAALKAMIEHQHVVPAGTGTQPPPAPLQVTGGPLGPAVRPNLGPIVVPPVLREGETIVVCHPDGSEASYTVEGVTPAQAGASYRLRPSATNPGVNVGDTNVPGSAKGDTIQGDAGFHGEGSPRG